MTSLQQRKLSSLLLATSTTVSTKLSPLRQILPQKPQSLTSIKKSNLTCTFSELPTWMKDNSAIIRGYRRPTFSYLKCVESLFYFHNESVNIWSHFFGAMSFLFFSIVTFFYLRTHPGMELFEITVFYCFLFGAMICLGCSSAFHTMSCHSEKVCANWNRCDYIGIVALIAGSNVPLIYYGFYCDYLFKFTYLFLISLFSISTISVAVSSKFRTPEFRWFRTLLFILLGSSSLLPILHSILIYGVSLSRKVISLEWFVVSGSLYIIGAIIYGSRIPERLSPGTFDFWFSSHQIFHFFVNAAAFFTYYGLLQSMSYWHEKNSECQLSIESMKDNHYKSLLNNDFI